MTKLRQLFSRIQAYFSGADLSGPAPGTVELVNYYEEQITRLSIAWLANRTGNPSEFGYLSQAEIVTAFEQEIDCYQKHSRALRVKVGGRVAGVSTQEPLTRLPICQLCAQGHGSPHPFTPNRRIPLRRLEAEVAFQERNKG